LKQSISVLYDESQTTFMKIAIASDHAGRNLKEQIKKILDSVGLAYEDLGTNTTDSVDYPDYAKLVAESVQDGNRGILCCSTGIGMSIAANKFKGVRAALCTNALTAQLSREHNDSNVLILGERIVTDADEVSRIVQAWLQTEFAGGRHQRRVEKIKALEES
jgi:ribose 5-phosphate isomerase B